MLNKGFSVLLFRSQERFFSLANWPTLYASVSVAKLVGYNILEDAMCGLCSWLLLLLLGFSYNNLLNSGPVFQMFVFPTHPLGGSVIFSFSKRS